jgi:hypothetical protein
MENIVKKIIELEHNAQSLVSEGHAEADRIREAGEQECSRMEAGIMEMAEKKIKQLENKNRRETDDRVIRIYEDTAMKMRFMEETAEMNRRIWEKEIFDRIIRSE